MKKFGLIGRNINYSFSRAYFNGKFKSQGRENELTYVNFDMKDETELKELLNNIPEDVRGFNVTIPYKQEVINHIEELDDIAAQIGAVNTIKMLENGSKKGYNTDCIGFIHTLKPLLKKEHKKALILGTGGASKAIAYALNSLGISYKYVSRNPSRSQLHYDLIDQKVISDHLLIINCTPLGTSPNTKLKPSIPYQYLNENHLLYDLIYNPEITAFMKEGLSKGAVVKNGYDMLVGQAEAAWEIWNN